MIEFSDDEITTFEENIESVFVEKTITISNPSTDIFSAGQKIGMSINVPPNSTPEKTYKYANQQINYYLEKWRLSLPRFKK